ncbi:RNA polymerase sigma factor [Saccharicrinis sp. FJH54]|uniref:RNA polymerase sigma factor n=1 Tax=Saccharicrinis sp. FJH54 TaxID=3344665 RepID=UPI0035D3FF55
MCILAVLNLVFILQDKEILERIAKGDKQAFAIVYNEYYKPLCYYAYKFFQDDITAEDIVQKTMVKLWEQRRKITEINSISSFLYRTVHNNSINELKHRQVIDKHADNIKSELDAAAYESPDEEYEDRLNKTLMDAINDLPPKKSEIFKLKYFKGMKHKEIAEQLGISYRTVETHIVKGLQKLRETLGDKKFFADE